MRLYKGWIKCSDYFQKMAGFNYISKQKRHGSKVKFFGCAVTDEQLKGMKENWNKFKDVDIEWELEKEVDSAYGIHKGDVLLSLLGWNYFFNKYDNIRHFSRLREWKTYNGITNFSDGKSVREGYAASKTHIKSDCSVYSTLGERIDKNTLPNHMDTGDIELYISMLGEVKNKLVELNEK